MADSTADNTLYPSDDPQQLNQMDNLRPLASDQIGPREVPKLWLSHWHHALAKVVVYLLKVVVYHLDPVCDG
jgi:hypothetical protein